MREFVDAARAEGLRVGLYYSLMDWHHPDGMTCQTDPQARKRFVDYTHGLIRELMTNYGKIDILWYDVDQPLTAKRAWETCETMNNGWGWQRHDDEWKSLLSASSTTLPPVRSRAATTY